MPLRPLLAYLLLLLAALPARGELPETVLAQLRAANIPEDAVGALVQRLSDGKMLMAHEPERSRQPASTMKLVTSWIALEKLGPAYRGRTELRTGGEVVDGVLRGNLALRGLGDVDFDWHAFERMLQQLRHQGIREIRGDLLLDLSFFKPTRMDIGVSPFDHAPEFRYNVIPDALMLNTNLLQLDLAADGAGLRVAMTPPLERVSIAPEMKLVERICESWEDGWTLPALALQSNGSLRIRLQGEFPYNCFATTSINVIDRVTFADRLFRALWRRLGGTFHGRTREGETAADARLLAKHRSRALADVIRDINKESDNPITRVIFLTLGALSDSFPDEPTLRRADLEVRAWLERRGIDHKGIVLENGSGLSRTERISPAQLAAVLRAANRSEWAPEFLASLPIVSVDGTMRGRLRESPAAARSRIKTGTLRDVTAVAGYVTDDSGETHIVVAMINHLLATSQGARPILDALVDWVARSRAPAKLALPAKTRGN